MTVLLLISSFGVNAVYADDEITVDTPAEGGEITEVIQDTENNDDVLDEEFEEDVGDNIDFSSMTPEEAVNYLNDSGFVDKDIELVDEEGNTIDTAPKSDSNTSKDGELIFGYEREFEYNNKWINPDYEKYAFSRDAEVVAFAEAFVSFEDKQSDEFAEFMIDNKRNLTSFADLVNPDTEVFELYFSGDVDYQSIVKAQEIFNALNRILSVTNSKLAEDEENEVLKERVFFLSIITSAFKDLAGSAVRPLLRAGYTGGLIEEWSLRSTAWCMLYNRMYAGGGIQNVGGSVVEWTTGGLRSRDGVSFAYDCDTASCTVTSAYDTDGIDYVNIPVGSLNNGPKTVTKADAKSKGNCYDCDCDMNGTPDADACTNFAFYHDDPEVVAVVATRHNGLRIMMNGQRVFCLDENKVADKCSIYYSGTSSYVIGADQALPLAIIIGAYHKGAISAGRTQTLIWQVRHGGLRYESSTIQDLAGNSDTINNHIINFDKTNIALQSKASTTVTDGSGELAGTWKHKYTITAPNHTEITPQYNPATSNTLTIKSTDPYPINRTISMKAGEEDKSRCAPAQGGTVNAYQGPKAWGGLLSGEHQPFLVDGEFSPSNCIIERFVPQDIKLRQPAGNIEFVKISERTGQRVSCPYTDVFGVSHDCNSQFAIYMLKDESDPTYQKYSGTSMDTGVDVTYEGKTYRRIRISTNGSGDNSHWKDTWTLNAQGTITTMPTTGENVVPEGVYYVKEIATNTAIWDLNKNYYKVTVRDGQTVALDGAINSSGENTGGNFPNQEFGALKIVKYTEKHTTKNNAEVAKEALNSNTFTEGFGNTFPYQARFRLYIAEKLSDGSDNPLWNSQYDATANNEQGAQAIPANAANNNSGVELHVLRVNQDGNTSSNTGQYEYPNSTNGSWTYEWITNNGIIEINSIPVKKYTDGVDRIEVYVKETWVNTDFQALNRDYTLVTITKNANSFNSVGTNRHNETNNLYASLQIDKFILGGLGKETATYNRVHAQDTYVDSYGDTYDAVAIFALYIDKDNPLWRSEYDCSIKSPEVCPVVRASDPKNTVGKELHQVRIYRTAANNNNSTNAKYATAEDRIPASGGNYYEYRWTTINGHIDITQIPVFPRNWVETDQKSSTFYLKEIETNDSIFQLNKEYKSLELKLNTNTMVEIDNAPRGTIELHKYDEDSMVDGTPRKVKSDYCSQAMIDQGTYCDLPSNKALSDYFVLLIDNTSPLWGVTKEQAEASSNGIDANIGAYDAGAYYAYDEDWGGLGYIKSISVAKDDKHDSAGTDSDYSNRSSLAANTVSSGSVMYEMEFTQNASEAVLHVVKIMGYNDFNGPDKDKYTNDITEQYEDGNDRVFEAGVHWHPDTNGDLYIKYLPEGSYYVKEHSVDPNVFSLDEYIYKVDVVDTKVNKLRNLVASELDPAPEWTFANTSIKTGGLEFVKLDEEGHNAGAGHVYEIYYVNDNVEDKKTAQLNGNSIQNAAGQWGKDISNSYELARTVSAKKHYLDGYLENGKQIPVDEEGNKIVKYQINVDETHLTDNPGEYIYKGTGNAVSQFVTNEDGRIYIERLPIGTYILIEVDTYDPYDLVVDSNDVRGVKFSVEDDQGKVFENGYRFSVDSKLVTCLNGKENPTSRITGENVCQFINQYKNKNNTQVPSGLFADTETRTNQVKVGEHNADVTTTITFHTEDREGNVVKDFVTFTGVVNENLTKRGSFKLYKWDEYGNTGNQTIDVIHGTEGTSETITGKYGDVGDKVFELYYLDENEVFETVDGEKWFTQGTYSDEELVEHYTIPEEVAERLQDGKVLAVQVDNVNTKGIYKFKHWKSSTVDFDNGEVNNAVYQFVTNEEGIIEIDQVPVGEYLLIEVGTTNAFLLNIRGEDVQTIEEGAITEFDVTNYNRNVDFEIRKVDRDKEDTPLKDAEFVVYDITNTFRADYQTEDMTEVPEGEMMFVRMGKKVDLYDVLIKGRELEEIVNNRPVKYSMNNVDYAAIDSDGYLYSNATGKVDIHIMGGVYSLYGNLPNRRFYTGTSVVLNNLEQMDRTSVIDANQGLVVINEGREIQFYKDAAHKEPVSVESLLVTLPVDYDINTPGTYTIEYKLISTDHIIYNFTREITFEDRNPYTCMYYPESGKWLQGGKICKTTDPDIKDTSELNVNLTDPISLISSTDAGDWNGTDLGTHEVYILKDGGTTSKIFPAGQDSATIVGTKVFKAITGHITIVVQDYQNHNYPIANGELVTYTDEECTNVFKTYIADELGMVDLTEDAGSVDKLYFKSYINDDGYYTDTPQVVEIDMTPRLGYAQVKNLKHSRKYLICETKVPNGFNYSPEENACILLDTTDDNYGENMRNGKRVIYSENPEIMFTLHATKVDVDEITYNKVADNRFEEDNFEEMIQRHNDEYALFEYDSNEEQMNTFGNTSITIGGGIFSKYGSADLDEDGNVIPDTYEPLKNVVFDVYEYYGADGNDTAALQDGTEYNWAADIVKSERQGNHNKNVNYVGRFSTGMIYETFLDDEGNPIANEIVEISQDPTFDTIYMEGQTDENGLLVTLGDYLSDGTWYYRLKRPLKPEYQACYETTEVPEYCNVAPSENDYVQFADLPKAYAKIYDLHVSFMGEFEIPNMRVASTYIISEVANYDKDASGEIYVLPDDDVAYVINLSYTDFDSMHQSVFRASILNDRSRHGMGTKVDESFAMLIDGMTIVLNDIVHMDGLKPGAVYDIKGYLGDKQTREEFLDVEGNRVEGLTQFTADKEAPTTPHGITYVEMDVPVVFELNASDVLAKYPEGSIELVVMEELWTTTYEPRKVDEHKDWEDEGQTIELAVPKIGTTVINYEENKNIYEEEEFKFTDTIMYENLMPGEEFNYVTTIHVRSMEDEDLGPLMDKNGEPVVVTGTFVPETRNGTFDVEITLDTTDIAEEIKGIVVFEELYYKGYLAAEHKDIKDDGQTLIKRHKPKVEVRKVDENGELLEGAKLSLIDKRTNEVLDTWTSVLEPHDVTELVKVDKTYILREEEGIDHYYMAKDVEFTVPDKYEAGIEVLVTDMVDNHINYVIVKTDDSGEMLQNAKMELYEYDKETKEYTLVDEWTTVLEEHDISDVVKAGHIYKVVESETPGGYYQFVDYTFQIPTYGTSEKITVTMVDVEAKIRFIKLDSVTKQTVEGGKYAIFELLADTTKDMLKDKTVEELEKAEAIKVITYYETVKDEEGQDKDINGKEIAKLLDTSKTYYVQEVKAPFGYELDKEAHELKINGTKDNIQKFESSDVPMIVYVRVAKADKDNVKHYLAGAEITIYKNDGTVAKTKDGKDAIGVTDKNGVVTFMLNFDQNATYYAQETKAPAGYYLNKNKFDVKVSSTYTFFETDVIGIDILDQMMIIPKLIQTGAGRAALIAVPTIAVAAIALILVNKKKGKKREED